VPASAAGQTITIRAGFAARHGPIGLASEYTLTVTAASTGCEMGAECGGQVANFCGSACPRQCGVDAGFCTSQCVNGFFCPTGSSWDGASTSCVLTGECGTTVAPPPPPLVVVPACPADLDGDNTVNVNDVLQLMSAFGR
jgi:hypothetical protein